MPAARTGARPRKQPTGRKKAASAAAGATKRASTRKGSGTRAKSRAKGQPPTHFERRWAEVWRACKAQLVKQHTWLDTDLPHLDGYVASLRSAELARTEADREPFVEGSQEQLVAHPGYALAERHEKAALKWAQELLLTARQRAIRKLSDPKDDKDALGALLDGDFDEE